ncbi:LamG-like jellyroll fold domain-containing protein [Lactiplantibacillus mudanjiangensis]|uniref:LamG-like jellyroll fold domain-containing protein n=1 Tax=Lactiplantibacillus mudanjiangensis TaxID=1296538 RepID=A0A660E3V3_9LACO|nr:LamG-like jellyroll fold domain-containing protein [Lactiplantibacillus mudanjiangensis]VDG24113.1 hypothetical protein [Lactobacillus paracollinoides] [Lactiplantibacillus mudanjiangensis]VDG30290.1 hypothetical protein [Lactobacillus paracollinoides] [Lactiplantibacillus mudanjiangensis]
MNSRVLTTIALCSATLILMTTAAPATAAIKTNANQPRVSRATTPATAVKPFADIDLSKASPVDKAGAFKDVKTIGSGKPTITDDRNVDGKVTAFDGNSGYALPLDTDFYKKLDKGVTIEAFFKYSGSDSGEHDILSNQQGGGLGLGVNNGQLTFFVNDRANDGNVHHEQQLKGKLERNKWIHAVGVIDTQAKESRLYINGQLAEKTTNDGTIKRPNNAANNFVIGGDSGPNNALQFGMTGEIKTAKIYDQALTVDDISQLSATSLADVHAPKAIVEQGFNTQLVGPSDVVAGHTYNLNVHTRQLKKGDINKLEYDVVFDADKFEYSGADSLLGGKQHTQVTRKDDHTLHIVSTAGLSTAEAKQFSQTRLARIQLKAKATKKNVKATITVKDVTASIDDKKVTKVDMNAVTEQAITIHAKDINDYNGDGIIGVGDVALAPTERKAAVAQAAEIRPYKHVVVLTTDGGGNPWDPEGMYYTKSNSILPKWTTDKTILSKRENAYTMDLFNNKFAMSTSAKSVKPSISAQNYSSMLHGIAWGEMEKSYQMDNASAAQKYFADFDKKEAKYPSIFKVLQHNIPTRGLAAFAEWDPIINGIIEPDATVQSSKSAAWKSFDDVANYIDSDQFNDTALMYMQSDQMDHQGHSHGWYNDEYWKTYKNYDAMFKRVMDNLEKTGHVHDTLVIANADHGGSGLSHGSSDPSNMDIFLGLGGETVDAGRRLKGGSNADISALVLNALQVKKPSSMKGEVFDTSAFLPQTELAKKKRAVETVTLERTTNQFALKFKAQGNRQIRTVDTRIDLGGQDVDKIVVPTGAKVVRQGLQNGVLKLTLSFDRQPSDTLATVTLKSEATKSVGKVAIKEAMLGTDKGQEVLSDLTNKDVASTGEANGGQTTKPTEPSESGDGNQTTKPTEPGNPGDGNLVIKPEQPGLPGDNGQTTKPTKPTKPNESGNGGQTTKPKPSVPGNNDGHASVSGNGNTTAVKPTKPATGGSVTNVVAPHEEATKPEKHKKNNLKGKIVYAQKKLGFYKKTTFTKKNRYKFFTARSQNKWAQFKIVKKQGNRYQVKDINKGSKTYGKTGYITTNSKYVTSAEYTKKAVKVKVINARGLSAYKTKALKGKTTHYKKDTVLKVKQIVKVKGKYRFQLKNGKYITADKHMVHAYFVK